MSGIDKCYSFPLRLLSIVRFRKNVLNFTFNEVSYWERVVRYILYFEHHVVSTTCYWSRVCVCVCVPYNSNVHSTGKFRPNRVMYDIGKKADSVELLAKQIVSPVIYYFWKVTFTISLLLFFHIRETTKCQKINFFPITMYSVTTISRARQIAVVFYRTLWDWPVYTGVGGYEILRPICAVMCWMRRNDVNDLGESRYQKHPSTYINGVHWF